MWYISDALIWLWSVIIYVREDKLVERAKVLKVNAGTEPGANLGPVISNQVIVYFRLAEKVAHKLYDCQSSEVINYL